MKLDDFKSSIEVINEDVDTGNLGNRYQNMTAKQLRWLITMSGKSNPKAYPKGNAPDINPDWFPKKAKRENDDDIRVGKGINKKNPILGPGDKPSYPFTKACPKNDSNCIANKANEIVQDYFGKVSAGVVPRPSKLKHGLTKNRLRKRYQSPRPDAKQLGSYYDKETGRWYAKRPAGISKTSGKMNWDQELNKVLGTDLPQLKRKEKEKELERSLTPRQRRAIKLQQELEKKKKQELVKKALRPKRRPVRRGRRPKLQ